ncbi:hypothetical protein ACVWWQ_000761 [Rhodanobacter sp. TND4EL1]
MPVFLHLSPAVALGERGTQNVEWRSINYLDPGMPITASLRARRHSLLAFVADRVEPVGIGDPQLTGTRLTRVASPSWLKIDLHAGLPATGHDSINNVGFRR